MSKLQKTSLNISDPHTRIMLQNMFMWVETTFHPMDTNDLELSTFYKLKSIAESMKSKFFGNNEKVKLRYYEMDALYQLIQMYPEMTNQAARDVNMTIHPKLQEYRKPSGLLLQ